MRSMICITGAAGGLGKAMAAECAQRGWDLFLTDLDPLALGDLAGGLSRAYEVEVRYQACDLTDAAARSALFASLAQEGRLFWGLINVAGLDYEGRFTDRSGEQLLRLLRLNIEANLEMTRTILGRRDEGKTFRLINVASLAAFYPMPLKATYAASKRFLLEFSLALREELRADNCTVTALCPAGLPTTKEAIRGIEAQGLAGRVTTKNVGYVAARTIDRALRGRAVYIPGLVNQLLRALGRIVPAIAVTRLLGGRWEAAQRRSGRALPAQSLLAMEGSSGR